MCLQSSQMNEQFGNLGWLSLILRRLNLTLIQCRLGYIHSIFYMHVYLDLKGGYRIFSFLPYVLLDIIYTGKIGEINIVMKM